MFKRLQQTVGGVVIIVVLLGPMAIFSRVQSPSRTQGMGGM
jgi:hypothetical protein